MTGARNESLTLRRARAEDLEAIAACHGETPWLRPAFADPTVGPGRFTVAVDGDRVVSSLCLLDATLELEGTRLAVGSPEWVGTHPDYRGRGLVRAQLEEVHRWSKERGDLVQLIDGIPYFYRKFGYQYAIDKPPRRLLPPAAKLAGADGWHVRAIDAADVPALAALYAADGTPADLVLVRDAADSYWQVSLGNPDGRRWVVAEHDGQLGAMALVVDEPDENGWTAARAVTAVEPAALWPLLAAVRGPAGTVVTPRPSVAPMLDPVTVALPAEAGFYVRIADPERLLDHLRPVLSARLAASPFASASGELVISTYANSIVLPYHAGEVGPVRTGAGIQNPVPDGAAGIPPDHLAELIFGRHGPTELEARYDDVELGSTTPLIQTLFPKLRTNLQ
jgi:GNAT superfamily N-acetyltransferase